MCDLDVPAEQTHSVELELGISNIAINNNTVVRYHGNSASDAVPPCVMLTHVRVE